MTTSMSCFSVFFSVGSSSKLHGLAVDAKAHIALRLHVLEHLA